MEPDITKMQPGLLEIFAKQLAEHPSLFETAKYNVLDELASAALPYFPYFIERLPEKKQFFSPPDEYHFLSFDRIYLNRAAEPLATKHFNGWREFFCKHFKSKELIVTQILASPAIIELMAASEHPYSLSGSLESHFQDEDEEVMTCRPIILIPGNPKPEIVHKWEDEHTREFEEKRFLIFPYTKEVKAER
ncbi:MAG: hypothetical protein V1837_06365 [Candidatus Woesearchaeota archaeon]